MSIIDDYNNFKEAIALKFLIDGEVQISLKPNNIIEVRKKQYPDLTIEFYHDNHQYWETKRYSKAQLKLCDFSNVSGLLSVLQTGDKVGSITVSGSTLVFTNCEGKNINAKASKIELSIS